MHKGNHTKRSRGFSTAGCNCFARLLHSSEPAGRGICWRLPVGVLIQLGHGELCPMTPGKLWLTRTKSQWHTLHHSQLSPALTAKDGRPGQTAPCYGPGKGLCPWGCVCTGLILLWKNVWFPFYTLWITNRHSDPGRCLNNTEVCVLGTRMFPHQAEALFAQQRLPQFWALESPLLLTTKSFCFCSKLCLLIFRKNIYL